MCFEKKVNCQNCQKSQENRTNIYIDIILLFLAKPLDKHGTTLVPITYPPLLSLGCKSLRASGAGLRSGLNHIVTH